MLDAWEHDNAQWKVGRPFTYSDLAIQTLLSMRELFRLTYRQTKGFGLAMAKLMQADVAIPDYTSLQKRAAKLGVSISFATVQGPIDVVVDSTGLKVYGEGEWKCEWRPKRAAPGMAPWRPNYAAHSRAS